MMRIAEALQDAGLDALMCTLPTNVLMLSGYWPVVGTAMAVATRDGRVVVLAPEDERDLASRGWAAEVRTFQPGSLTRLVRPTEVLRDPLAALLADEVISDGRIGYEDGDAYEQASHAAMYLYGGDVVAAHGMAAPHAVLVSGSTAITRLRSVLTPYEVDQVRTACQVAGPAFEAGTRTLRPGPRCRPRGYPSRRAGGQCR